VASPNQLAQALGEALGSVSYHVRILRELDCVELVSTAPRRGALEHYYRATVRPGLDDEEWARLPSSVRRETLGRTLSEIFEEASKASLNLKGGHDDSETHMSRIALALDEQARTELSALLAQTHEAALHIHADSASRHAQYGPDGPPAIATELWLIHFQNADAN
jgi:DNA-binding transcriptional ArsR family regulator